MPLQFDLFARRTLFGPRAVTAAIERVGPVHLAEAGVLRLQRWQAILLDEQRRAEVNEPTHAQSYLRDVFEHLLGYATVGASEEYHLSFETAGPQDRRPADGVLGFFGSGRTRVRGVVEVKKPGTNLDARSSRADNLSAVDQAFLYASNFEDVRWVIVTNFDEIRLYSRMRGKTVYEPFRTVDLRDRELARFAFLLHRTHLLGDGEGPSPSEEFAQGIWLEQAEISSRFYQQYQEARVELFEELRRQNPEIDPSAVLNATQMLLDRLLFVMFCSDRALLPAEVLDTVLADADRSRFSWRPDRLWNSLRDLFHAVNVGHPPSRITGYNGGLFAPSLVDELTFDEPQEGSFILRRILAWDGYDFESQLDVDILGHIFENSISDLEQLREEIAENPAATRLLWRNHEGIFYTPDWVTSFVVRRTVSRYLEDNPDVGPEFAALDPACGSGAFLVQLIPTFLDHIRQLAPDETAEAERAYLASAGQMDLIADPGRLGGEALYAAIRRGVYGVDKSHESVEITRLAFWLKTAIRGRALPSLGANILAGNSLCPNPEFAADAFRWEERLSGPVERGFDVVIGNPPWNPDVKSYSACLDQFVLARGQYDPAFLFIELAIGLLKEGGYLGFVLPDSLLINREHEPVRRMLLERTTLREVIKLGEGVFSGVFRGAVILIVQKGAPREDHRFDGLVVTKSDRKQITDVAQSVDLETLLVERGATIPQIRLLGNLRLEFDIFVGEEDEALITKIEANSLDWSSVLVLGRGIELNKEGWVIRCPACFTWDAPPAKRKGFYRSKICTHCEAEYELEDAFSQAHLISEEGGEPRDGEAWYVDGTDVNRYRIENRRKIDISKEGINYKEPELYASPKIVFRQAGIGITATIDYDWNAYVPQSAYVLRLRGDRDPDHARYRLEYFLGVLNSRLMLYYYFKKTGQVEWQSFPRWTLERVRELPVRRIDWDDPEQVRLHDEIADAVEALIRRGATGNPEEDLHVERLVMRLYGLSFPEETKRVWSTLKGVQELKVIREVMPPEQGVLV